MRIAIIGLVFLLLGGTVQAAQDDPRLDTLFVALGETDDPTDAEPIEAAIVRIWAESDDAINTRLLRQGNDALARGVLSVASISFDHLIDRAPEFAEAWNQRAMLHYLIGDDRAALADIGRTLELEPRHFGALSGLAMIMLRNGQPEAALRSFEAALELHPHLPTAQVYLEPLRELVEGRLV